MLLFKIYIPRSSHRWFLPQRRGYMWHWQKSEEQWYEAAVAVGVQHLAHFTATYTQLHLVDKWHSAWRGAQRKQHSHTARTTHVYNNSITPEALVQACKSRVCPLLGIRTHTPSAFMWHPASGVQLADKSEVPPPRVRVTTNTCWGCCCYCCWRLHATRAHSKTKN
jgi:hypothetical protein